MELKQYQQEVINDLTKFIEFLEQSNNLKTAFSDFWESKGILLKNIDYEFLKPYDNSIKNVPRVTVKVPTAGGKTFIACNALKPIFDSFPIDKPQVVVWFVPSDTILKQTYKNLNDTSHPYRQKIDSHFGSRVKVYLKDDLLQGASFNPTIVKEQLSIFVLSVQSFSARNKEARKAYQENENLAEFPKTFTNKEKLLNDVDETALMQVIAQLNPVIVIDESHNFEADLRIEMLNAINPSFIFDLTATPREKSNIISFVDAIKLKQNNMVKLPVIVYNHKDTNEVINSAINLQKVLEQKAKLEVEKGGKFIRPIVLFQAQPKSDKDNITFEKIKKDLIDFGIPESHVKIKTADKDEIKNIDLMHPYCEVRYIITVNALKEGWDCPFAYILASLANKSSAVDVEQILGRVLRLPFTRQHSEKLLNFSYVFTSSNNFLQTLAKIILGLNKAGFSAKDYRVKTEQTEQPTTQNPPVKQGTFEELFATQTNTTQSTSTEDIEIDVEQLKQISQSEQSEQRTIEIIETALNEGENYEKRVEEIEKDGEIIPTEIKDKVKTYPIKETYKDEVKNIKLPNFFLKKSPNLIDSESFVLLTKKELLLGFDLSKEDHKIDFTQSSSEMASIDLVEGRKDEYVPAYRHAENQVKEAFVEYITNLSPESKINQIAMRLAKHFKNMNEISDPAIVEYIKNVIKDLNSEKLSELTHNESFYVNKIKEKIEQLTDIYAEKKFIEFLDKGIVICQDEFEFHKKISPKNTLAGITKNLYVEEGEMNDFERKVIYEISNLDSVVFWHRNLERGKGFLINGFINHYPDFIVKMKSGKIIIIETKGSHLDNTDSSQKIRLGEKWASKAGDKYRYFMVFDKEVKMEGAKTISQIIEILKDMK